MRKLLCSLRGAFHLLKTVHFKDIQNNSMPELNEVACRVADSLDRLIDSITQIDCTNNATGEEQFREQFDYIEDKEIFCKLTLPEANENGERP